MYLVFYFKYGIYNTITFYHLKFKLNYLLKNCIGKYLFPKIKSVFIHTYGISN